MTNETYKTLSAEAEAGQAHEDLVPSEWSSSSTKISDTPRVKLGTVMPTRFAAVTSAPRR